MRIFLEAPESGFRQTRAYFESRGVQLAHLAGGGAPIAAEAARQPRLGARALKEVFRRVIRDYEFDPEEAAAGAGALLIDLPEVERALRRE